MSHGHPLVHTDLRLLPHKVLEGLVRTVAATPDGRETTTTIYLPGDIIFPADPSGAQHYGMEGTALRLLESDLEISRHDWTAQFERHGQLHAIRRLEAVEAIPTYLEHLAHHRALKPEDRGFGFPGTHQHLAMDLNVNRETVSKALVHIRSTGRIETGYRMLILTSPPRAEGKAA